MPTTDHKTDKNRARRRAARLGLALDLSRVRAVTIDDHGLYQLVDAKTGKVIAGPKHDLTLDDVEAVLADRERKILAERSR